MLVVPTMVVVVIAICAIGYRVLTGRQFVVYRDAEHTQFFEELKEWTEVLTVDLVEHLNGLQLDKDIYGFTLAIPEDFEFRVVPGIARESYLVGEQTDSLYWLDQRYLPSWEYLPHGKYYSRSNEFIEGRLKVSQSAESLSTEVMQSKLLAEFHHACLQAMLNCDQKSAFGSIWFKVLSVSDSEFDIVRRSFYVLNRGRSLKEGKSVYPRF